MKISMQRHASEKTISGAFEEFLFIKSNENVSKETIKDYENIFSIFMGFYGKETPCSEITENTIHEYIAHLKTRPKRQNRTTDTKKEFLSDVTIATYVRHLRAILNVFMDFGYVKKFVVKVPKSDKEIKEVYGQDEIDKLIRKPNLKQCSFSEYRNWVITNYLLSTANRLSTVINLKIKDLDFRENEIHLSKVKNRKSYSIPMQKDLKKILLEYLKYRGGSEDDYLFCNEKDSQKQLSKDALKHAIYRYNLRRGVIKTSIHLYRNTFAKHWILSGGDVFRLQKILGHSTLDIVKEYVDMYGKDLQKDFDIFNPLSAYAKGEKLKISQ